jgi:hypothetical protein
VEAQVSFCAVPIKNQRHRLLVILRALTLLDSEPSMVLYSVILLIWRKSTFIQKADIARVTAEKSKPKLGSMVLKRKVGYTENDSDEEEREVRILR